MVTAACLLQGTGIQANRWLSPGFNMHAAFVISMYAAKVGKGLHQGGRTRPRLLYEQKTEKKVGNVVK